MIEINNLTTNQIDEDLLKKVAKKILKSEKKEKSELSIAFIGQQRMRELNRRYRGENRATDVLSFGLNKKSKFIIPSSKLHVGEIVICLTKVRKNAKKFGSTFKKELTACLIHGVLHLFNYDHKKGNRAAKRMRKKEKFYLDYFFK